MCIVSSYLLSVDSALCICTGVERVVIFLFLSSNVLTQVCNPNPVRCYENVAHEVKTYLWVVCESIYESQGGLGEECTWTVRDHGGGSFNQGVLRKVFHLL